MYNRENNAKEWKLGSQWLLVLFWTVENIVNIATLLNPGNGLSGKLYTAGTGA